MFIGRMRERRPRKNRDSPASARGKDSAESDIAVDVLCVGIGPPTLAAAISAAGAGMDVLIADCDRGGHEAKTALPGSSKSWPIELRSAWSTESLSAATMTYLRRITDDVASPRLWSPDVGVTQRRIDGTINRPKRSKPTGAAAPFYGHGLLHWAFECLNSPYGLLYSRTSIPGASEFVQQSGARLEVSSIGRPPDGPMPASLSTWMLERARQRGAEVRPFEPLRRLTFQDVHVVGAVFGDSSRAVAVHARHGVALYTSSGQADESALQDAWQSTGSHLGLVSSVASRFGRLELLTDQAPKPSRRHRTKNAEPRQTPLESSESR
jgi:hypothetical protein